MNTGFFDWTEDNLHLYIFNKKGHVYELSDIRSVPLENELETSHISSLSPTALERVYLSIPMSLLTLREQRFPFTEREKIRDTISFELEGLLLGNASDYTIDHMVTETLDTGSTVLAVCLEKRKAKEILDMFISVGLDPRVITSIDLWLLGGNGENVLAAPISDTTVRAETAKKELSSPSINLRQGDLAYTGDIDQFKTGLRRTAALILILFMLLGIHSALSLFQAKKENKALETQALAIYRSVYPEDRKILDIVRQFRGNLNILKRKKDLLGGIPALEILQEIAMQKHGTFTLYEFNADTKNIILKGTALSYEEVETVQNALSSPFDAVKVMDSSATADEKIQFTIVMQEKSL